MWIWQDSLFIQSGGIADQFWKLLIYNSQCKMLFNTFCGIWTYALVYKWVSNIPLKMWHMCCDLYFQGKILWPPSIELLKIIEIPMNPQWFLHPLRINNESSLSNEWSNETVCVCIYTLNCYVQIQCLNAASFIYLNIVI